MKLIISLVHIASFSLGAANTTNNDNDVVRSDDKQLRIVKGSSILNAELFPSYVSIRRSGREHFAGGVILDEYRILTAAHSLVTEKDTVYVGGTKRDGADKQQELKVRRSFAHPEANFSSLINDISVVELASPLTFTSRVQPVELGSETEFEMVKNGSVTCHLVGHGYTDGPVTGQPESVAEFLQTGYQNYTKKRTCRTWFGIDSDNCYVTRDQNGSQACHGDSGGPLYCDIGGAMKLFGIVSFVSSNTCSKGYTGITLPIRYKSFIDEILRITPVDPDDRERNGNLRTGISQELLFILIPALIALV